MHLHPSLVWRWGEGEGGLLLYCKPITSPSADFRGESSIDCVTPFRRDIAISVGKPG